MPKVEKNEIQDMLDIVEQEKGVKILFAVESGSRAWGFYRPESDYDVRFVYCRDADGYMSPFIEGRRDVLEPKIGADRDIDMVGWDLRKAMRLLAKTNPNLLEWLRSHIVYKNSKGFRADMLSVARDVFNPVPAYFHYSSIAKNAMDRAKNGQKVLKRQLYAIRSLLACTWVKKYERVPPMNVTDLMGMFGDDLRGEVQAVIERRRRGGASEDHWFSKSVQRWIEKGLVEFRADGAPKPRKKNIRLIERFFADTLRVHAQGVVNLG